MPSSYGAVLFAWETGCVSNNPGWKVRAWIGFEKTSTAMQIDDFRPYATPARMSIPHCRLPQCISACFQGACSAVICLHSSRVRRRRTAFAADTRSKWRRGRYFPNLALGIGPMQALSIEVFLAFSW